MNTDVLMHVVRSFKRYELPKPDHTTLHSTGGVDLEWCLTNGSLKLRFGTSGVEGVLMCRNERPTEEECLGMCDLEDWGHTDVQDYMKERGLGWETMAKEHYVIIILEIDSRNARKILHGG